MSVGLGLLYNILALKRSDPLSTLDEQGVVRSDFIGQEIKVYDCVRRHFIKFGVLPLLKTVETETRVKFPSFPEEPVGYWIERLKERRDSSLMLDGSQKIQELVGKGDADGGREIVKDLYIKISSEEVTGKVYQLQSLAGDVLKFHDKAQLSSGLSGVSFGIPYLDEVSGGAQSGDSVALVGSRGVGKTYLMLVGCLSCFAGGGKPLLGSLEMPGVQVARRLMALRSHVTAMAIRLGRLSHWARKKLEDDTNWLKRENLPFPIFQGTLKTTIEDIALSVQELRPTALYIDGAYLLRTRAKTSSRVERVTETAEWLKGIAKDFNIPVFGSYQFSRKGEIAWSSAIEQLASIVIGIYDEEPMEESEGDIRTPGATRILELLKGREGERGKIRINFDMRRMDLSQQEVLEGYALPDAGEERGEG